MTTPNHHIFVTDWLNTKNNRYWSIYHQKHHICDQGSTRGQSNVIFRNDYTKL